MLIHNATFMVDPQRGAEFLEWFAPLARKAGPEGKSRLSVMRQAGGETAGETQALCVAFQGEFESMEDVAAWTSKRLRPLVLLLNAALHRMRWCLLLCLKRFFNGNDTRKQCVGNRTL